MHYKYSKICTCEVFGICLLLIFFISSTNRLFPLVLNDIIKSRRTNELKELVKKSEDNYVSEFKQKYQFIEIFGSYAKLSDIKYINNVAKLNNGYIYGTVEKEYNVRSIKNNINDLLKLRDYAKQQNIALHFSIFPSILDINSIKLPAGLYDTINERTDLFINELKKNKIDYYDFRPFVKNLEPYYCFFKTDHHWTPRLAFDSYVELAKVFKEKYNISYMAETIDFNNFNSKIYSNISLGSMGRRTGLIYSGLDDIEVISPKFNTDITKYENYGELGQGIQKGNYNDIILYMDNIYGKDIYNTVQYNVYTDHNKNDRYINNNPKAKGKILIITDSFIKPSLGLFAINYKEIHVVNIANTRQNFYIFDLINEFKPDLISIQYNKRQLNRKASFNFK